MPPGRYYAKNALHTAQIILANEIQYYAYSNICTHAGRLDYGNTFLHNIIRLVTVETHTIYTVNAESLLFIDY